MPSRKTTANQLRGEAEDYLPETEAAVSKERIRTSALITAADASRWSSHIRASDEELRVLFCERQTATRRTRVGRDRDYPVRSDQLDAPGAYGFHVFIVSRLPRADCQSSRFQWLFTVDGFLSCSRGE